MNSQLVLLLQIIAYIGMAVGLIGIIAPIIPGTIIIWLSALLWAWADGFQAVGWPTLIVLGVLVVLAELSDWLFTILGAKKGGASWSGLAVAAIAAIVGFIIINFIGALAFAFLGLLGWEFYRHRGDWRKAWRSSRWAVVGYILSIVVKLTLGMFMVIIFVWQAFFTS